jgi:hypothetical protein
MQSHKLLQTVALFMSSITHKTCKDDDNDDDDDDNNNNNNSSNNKNNNKKLKVRFCS